MSFPAWPGRPPLSRRPDSDVYYEEILDSFEYPADEVFAAVRRIARPPRPVLSAVIVATGLRMGLAGRLAKLRSAHLQREISRWKFFSAASALPNTSPQRYIVLTPVNDYAHQKPRILAGKLTARIFEAVLGHGDGLSFHFVYALPACRPGTVPAKEREKLATLVRATIANTYLPERVRVTVLDDLYSDVWLPNLKGLPLILALRKLCSISSDDDVLALSEMNDSASWLNIVHLAAALPQQSPALVTGRRPIIGAGKPVAGHAATRLFNCLFRFLIPNVTVRDSSSVLKIATVASLRAILDDLTCLDYAIDQDILAMMTLRGRVVEKPIQWYQTRGRWGHERSAGAQIASLLSLSLKTRFKRRLATLQVSEWLPFDGGFDFQVFTNGRGRIRKAHARERNRLVLLLTSLRSMLQPGTSEREGHREFARFIPLATRLISIVGQGPLKSILRVAEAKYRDPLPGILEHLKYQTPVIVQTSFNWRPIIQTPIGPSDHYLFSLEQPLATLGTLRSAIELNLRLGDVRAAADTLKVVLNLQEALVAQGLVDPDLKSLLDCGIFIEGGLVTVKHLDFAGFLRDQYVIDAVLPGLFQKFVQMRDFRQIALLLGGTSVGRARVMEFREALEAFLKSVPARLSSVSALPVAPDPNSSPIPASRHAQRDFVDDVIATAKFASHAPIGPRPEQILMRRAIAYGSSRFIADQPTVTFGPFGAATSMPEPMFVVASQMVADILERDMKEYLPECRYDIVHVRTPSAIPLMSLVRDLSAQAGGAHVVMRVGGNSSRMQDLLGDDCPHKALMRVFGRPLFVHTLEGMGILATVYPERIWLTNPDTICIFGNRSEWPNVEAEVVAPLPIEAFRLFNVYERAKSAAGSRAEAAGKLLARCYLATRRGGYSLPPIIGMKRVVTPSLPDEVPLLGDFAQPDFWAYLSRMAALPERYRRGRVAAPNPQTWFDLDGPLELMGLYRHALVPGFVHLLGGVYRVCPTTWENSVNIESAVLMSGAGEKICLRNCVFDSSNVVIDCDPRLPQVCIDGLVVANSSVSIRIGAPAVRDNLIFGVTTAPGEALELCLDGQVIAMSSTGHPCALPLSLRGFTMPGQDNEILRCRAISHASRVATL